MIRRSYKELALVFLLVIMTLFVIVYLGWDQIKTLTPKLEELLRRPTQERPPSEAIEISDVELYINVNPTDTPDIKIKKYIENMNLNYLHKYLDSEKEIVIFNTAIFNLQSYSYSANDIDDIISNSISDWADYNQIKIGRQDPPVWYIEYSSMSISYADCWSSHNDDILKFYKEQGPSNYDGWIYLKPDSGMFDGKMKIKIGYYMRSNKVYPMITACDIRI